MKRPIIPIVVCVLVILGAILYYNARHKNAEEQIIKQNSRDTQFDGVGDRIVMEPNPDEGLNLSAEAKSELSKADDYLQSGDFKNAAIIYEKYKEQLNSNRQDNFGSIYLMGSRSFKKDYAKAMFWYKKASENKLARAMNDVGYMYKRGFGVKINYKLAMGWFLKADSSGYVLACNNIGLCYLNGLGVKKNLDSAIYWIKKGADNDCIYCALNLGYIYLNGYGGMKKDTFLAIQLMRRVEIQGEGEDKKNASAELKKLGLPSDSLRDAQ